MSQVFVSYSRQDNQFVLKLINILREESIPVWFDQFDIAPGTLWDQAIQNALESATHVLFIMSNRSVISHNVLNEINFAVEQGKILIPIMIETCPRPLQVNRLQYINFSQNEFDQAVDQLVKVLPKETISIAKEQTNSSETTSSIKPTKLASRRTHSESWLEETFASTKNSDNPVLIIQQDDNPIFQWQIVKDSIVVGRKDCDLVLEDRSISRHHIRIYKQDNIYFVQDLGSKNGTWVNGLQLHGSHKLQDGDEIHLGLAARLRFIGADATTPVQLEPPIFIRGDLRIDPSSRRIFIRGIESKSALTLTEFRLLKLLFVSSGRICTYDYIIEMIWPETIDSEERTRMIDSLIGSLCDKFDEVDPENQYVIAIEGQGFRLENPLNHQQ